MVERVRAAEVLDRLKACVEVLSRAGEGEAAAFARYRLGFCLEDLDHFEQARSEAERGMALAREAESPLAEFLNLRLLGNAWRTSGMMYKRSAELSHALGRS